MNNQIPPELFAQRPVRSEPYRERKGALRIRRLVFLFTVLAAFVGVGYAVSALLDGGLPTDDKMPHIKAAEALKEKPAAPGGIDIPHRDVEIFGRLEEKGETSASTAVEHLLPAPETPRPVAGGASSVQEPPAATVPVVTETSQDTENLPPAVKEAKEEDIAQALASEPAEKAVVMKGTLTPETMPQVPEVASPAPAPEKKAEEKKPEEQKVEEKKAEAKKEPAKPAKTEVASARLPKELFTGEPLPKTSTGGKTARVQLASMPDEQAAKKDMASFARKYSGQLSGTGLEIMQINIPGRGTYYRIVTESISEAAARQICENVKAAKGSCLVLK